MKCTSFLRLVLALCASLALPATAKPLEVWIMPNGANPYALMSEQLAKFTRETGLAAQVTVLDWSEAWSRIHAALESGQGPDVLQLGSTWVPYFASKGWLASVDPWADRIHAERFLPVSWATTRIDGSPASYGIPWFIDVRVLLGNRQILDSLGIHAADIATWQGYRAALRRIRDARLLRNGTRPVQPYGCPGTSHGNLPHDFAPWVWSEGGAFVVRQDSGWRSGLLARGTIVGIRKYLGFAMDSLADPAALDETAEQVARRFHSGVQVFLLSNSEIIARARIPGEWGGLQDSAIGLAGIEAFPVPAGSAGSVSFLGGSDLCLPKAKEGDPRALALLLFLTRGDILDAYSRRIGFLPPDRQVLDVWSKDPAFTVLVEQAMHGRAYPGIPQWVAIEGVLSEMFATIWSFTRAGAYSDEELYKVLAQYDAKINAILGAPAGRVPTLSEFQAILRAAVDDPAAGRAARPAMTGSVGAQVAAVLGAVGILGGLGALFTRRKRASAAGYD